MESLKVTTVERIAKLAEFYGIHDQLIKTIEELAELQHALCRTLLNTKSDSLKCEIADVWVMMQFLYMHYFDESEIVELAALKVERLIFKLKIEQGNGDTDLR